MITTRQSGCGRHEQRQRKFRIDLMSEELKQKPTAMVDLAQMEKDLLAQLNDATQDPRPILWKLAFICNRSRQPEPAMDYLKRLLALEPDLEKKAAVILALGQSMEQLCDWPGAIRFYREALVLEPMSNITWYFIHNNLGFCYNQIGNFAEGEKCCRAAIRINPARPNAHKNLGLALAGLGQYRLAAESYVAGTLNFAGDPRSYRLLTQLVQEHPELGLEFAAPMERCGKHVAFAQTASSRAMAENPYRVLLGLEGTPWQNLCAFCLHAICGNSIQIVEAKTLTDFIRLAEN
jgi:tetratricopeptide (TPR) repeat protein